MKALIVAAAAVGIGAVGSGGYVYVQDKVAADINVAVGNINAALGADGSFSYQSSSVNPLTGVTLLGHVAFRLGATEVTAETVSVSGVTGDTVGSVLARKLRITETAPLPRGGTDTPQRRDNRRLPKNSEILAEEVVARELVVRGLAGGQPLRLEPSMVSFDAARISGVEIEGGHGEPAQLAEIAIRDYGAGRKTSFSLSGFQFPVKVGNGFDYVGFARTSVSGLELATILDDVAHGHGANTRVSGESVELVSAWAGSPDHHKVDVDNVKFSSDQLRPGIWFSAFHVAGIRGEAGINPLGYASYDASVDSEGTLDQVSGVLDSGPMVVRARDVGTLTVSSRFSGIPANLDPQQPQAFASVMAVKLVSASIHYVDAGLVGRALAASARGDEDAGRKQILSMLAQPISAGEATEWRTFREAVSAFIASPHQIEFSLHPAHAVPLAALPAQIQHPESLPITLGLTAKASE